ncbi:MAG: hypothetical protein ACR652_14985, partial [Methylocystis sp.]|uniref:hypothetical protein n=1 Tax=Methylocystis sp. TaxID=1911079 RepID=UPI003DA4BEEF
KTAADVVLPPIMVSRKTMGDVEHLSKTLALPPDWMLARLLEAVAAEPNVAVNLLDGAKAPKTQSA